MNHTGAILGIVIVVMFLPEILVRAWSRLLLWQKLCLTDNLAIGNRGTGTSAIDDGPRQPNETQCLADASIGGAKKYFFSSSLSGRYSLREA